MTYITLVSESKRALSHEIQYHMELAPILNEFASTDFISRLAALAAVVNIVVDGVFTAKEIDLLCDKITQRLRDRRVIRVISSKASIKPSKPEVIETPELGTKSPETPGDTIQ